MENLKSIKNGKKIAIGSCVVVGAYVNLLALKKVIDVIGFSTKYAGPTWLGYNILQFLVFFVDVFLLVKFINNKDKRNYVFSLLLGFVTSVLIVSGTYLLYTNDLFTGSKEVIVEVLTVLGLSIMTVPLCSFIIDVMNKAEKWYSENIEERKDNRSYIGYFFAVWGIITVCYLPVLLSQWPGNFVFDAADEMRDYNNFLINHTISTHHTLFHPLLMGGCCSLGTKIFNNISLGYGLYTSLQMLVVTGAFAYLLWYFKRKNVPELVRGIVFLAVAFIPVYKWFSITATKDVLCGAFSLITAVGLMRLLYDREKIKWYTYGSIVISAILSCLFRNNMIYAIVSGGVLLIVFQKKWRSRLVIFLLIAGIFIGQKVTNKITFNVANSYSPDTYRESLSMPLQCLARVASYRKDELPDDQYNEILSYIPETDIQGYSPFISDTVKANANEALLKSNKINFFKLWAKVGLEFPDEYAESILSNTLGYWYPFNLAHCIVMDFSAYHKLIENGDQIEKMSYMPSWVNEIYSYLYYENNYRQIPVMGFLFRPTLYVWMIMFGSVYALYKKDLKRLSVFFIPLMYFGTLILGPVVALRYLFPIMTAMPIFAIVMLEKSAEKI